MSGCRFFNSHNPLPLQFFRLTHYRVGYQTSICPWHFTIDLWRLILPGEEKHPRKCYKSLGLLLWLQWSIEWIYKENAKLYAKQSIWPPNYDCSNFAALYLRSCKIRKNYVIIINLKQPCTFEKNPSKNKNTAEGTEPAVFWLPVSWFTD